MQYDLEERTATFGEKVIQLCMLAPRNIITIPILDQLVRSATSAGANYMEANGASSRKDFRNKIFICKKEAMESKYWLRILKTACSELTEDTQILQQEAHELSLIFSKISKSAT